MRRKKRDKNEPLIVEALKRFGCQVLQINDDSIPGVPDLLVRYTDINTGKPTLILMEVKTKRGKTSATQDEFMREWQGNAVVVRTIDDALKAVGR